MFYSLTFLSFLLLTYQGTAAYPFTRSAPNVNLAIARSINITGFPNIVAADRARAKVLKQLGLGLQVPVCGLNLGLRDEVSFPVTNAAVVYTANVGVGNPPTNYTLLIDTGSSNTWVGANKAYAQTSTSHLTIDEVQVTYGSGCFEGHEYIDQVTLSPDLVIPKQSIGVARIARGFNGYDGILGIGPVDLTKGTLIPDQQAEIPTVVDNLFSQGTIPESVVGISFEPTTEASVTNGELTFGGTDAAKFTGDITFTPITGTSPASSYWGIDQEIQYGKTTILSTTAGIVDTGTTLVLIATDAFNQYQKATGGVPDSTTGLLKITAAQFDALQPLVFNVGGTSFALAPNAQIWPRSLNTAIGGTAGDIYLIVADIGASSGQGLDFINGYTFLERFYSVFDTKNRQVGLATTPFTDATSN